MFYIDPDPIPTPSHWCDLKHIIPAWCCILAEQHSVMASILSLEVSQSLFPDMTPFPGNSGRGDIDHWCFDRHISICFELWAFGSTWYEHSLLNLLLSFALPSNASYLRRPVYIKTELNECWIQVDGSICIGEAVIAASAVQIDPYRGDNE